MSLLVQGKRQPKQSFWVIQSPAIRLRKKNPPDVIQWFGSINWNLLYSTCEAASTDQFVPPSVKYLYKLLVGRVSLLGAFVLFDFLYSNHIRQFYNHAFYTKYTKHLYNTATFTENSGYSRNCVSLQIPYEWSNVRILIIFIMKTRHIFLKPSDQYQYSTDKSIEIGTCLLE